MNAKKWKIGLIIAMVFGLLSAGAGLVAGMGWQAFVAVLCTSLATHLGAYLMKHPVENVKFGETEQIARKSSGGKIGKALATEGTEEKEKANGAVPLWLLAGILVLGAGCASVPTVQRPPSPAEQKFFVVTTNFAPVLALATNEVVTPDPVTQTWVTNYAVVTVTNHVPQYEFSPNTNATATAATVGAVTNLGAPGVGGLAAAIVGGLFGLYGTWRSRRSQTTAATLAQIIETGEQLLLTSPQGTALAKEWKAWMVKHQAQTGTIEQASRLVAELVDTEDARAAAAAIAQLIKQ